MRKSLFGLAIGLSATTANADVLIHNANGIQVDSRAQLQRFAAVHIGDDGKVIRTYARGERLPTARLMWDAHGNTVLPGLFDAHGHVTALGLKAHNLDLAGSATLGDMLARVFKHRASVPGWIVGRGWNQELWPEKRMPTARDIDLVRKDTPVWLTRIDGHAAVTNSAGLKAAGITRDTKDPPGGKIERDADGNPTGLLIDSATDLVETKIPAPSPEARDLAIQSAHYEMLRNGLTAVADMGTSKDDWNAMRRMADRGEMAMARVFAYATDLATATSIAGTRPTGPLYDGRLSLGGVKIYADGALGSRGAWLKRPYSDQPDTRGLDFLGDAELKRQVDGAQYHHFQVAIHAIGDAANAQAIRILEQLPRSEAGHRSRIEHAQVIDPTDIPRLAPAGIIASMQPTQQTSDRQMAEKRLGPGRLDGAYAWNTVLKSGARLAFGSDFPVELSNPFHGLAAAISRQDLEGQPAGGWRPHERLTFAQALHAFTLGAAYAAWAEETLGSLEPGKWADLIIVDRDVSSVDPQSLARTRVLETWVGGSCAYVRTVPVQAAPERLACAR